MKNWEKVVKSGKKWEKVVKKIGASLFITFSYEALIYILLRRTMRSEQYS